MSAAALDEAPDAQGASVAFSRIKDLTGMLRDLVEMDPQDCPEIADRISTMTHAIDHFADQGKANADGVCELLNKLQRLI